MQARLESAVAAREIEREKRGEGKEGRQWGSRYVASAVTELGEPRYSPLSRRDPPINCSLLFSEVIGGCGVGRDSEIFFSYNGRGVFSGL